jgi:hypothetical protein
MLAFCAVLPGRKSVIWPSQGNVTRDATYFLNGTPIGARDIFQAEQGLGLGSGASVFNRHTISSTRFIKLRDPDAGSSQPPPVLVAHARFAQAGLAV